MDEPKTTPTPEAKTERRLMVMAVVQVQRAAVNIYLMLYAPMTGAAVQQLVCVDVCDADSAECEARPARRVLNIDYGVSCDSESFATSFAVAAATLALFAVLVPAMLVWKGRGAVRQRDASLKLDMRTVDAWFE